MKSEIGVSEELAARTEGWGLRLGDEQLRGLLDFARLLSEYEVANVVGTRDYEALVRDHVLDSLSCMVFPPLARAESLVDVGSGGGLPGIPLRLARPEMRALLVEATGKKARFLEQALESLSLREMGVANARAEEVAGQSEYRERYEVATVRAVASLSTVAEYCAPLVRVGGYVVAMKGGISAEELGMGETAGIELGMEVVESMPVPVGGDRERNLVVFEKVEKTPGRFPRKPGAAKKSPLGRR